MRYEKADNLLQLALEMQAARGGLSLGDIGEKFGVSRRTAIRMRDAVLRLFPQAEEVETGERTKRVRIPTGTLDRLIGFTADELADLDVAIDVLRRDNMDEQATSLEGLMAKLRAVMKPEMARRIEPDLEVLLEAEHLAMRPGPKPRRRDLILGELRDAIKACRVVSIKYRTRTTRRVSTRKVRPCGFLYGHRHYLVAYNLVRGQEGYRMFSLPYVQGVEQTDEYFEQDPDFSLEEFSKQAFGVFHEDPFDVAWRFTPRAAPDAREFVFHLDQVAEEQDDGSLIVRFRAGGALEMCWHLFCWGEDVEVLEPEHLAEMLNGNRQSWPGLP